MSFRDSARDSFVPEDSGNNSRHQKDFHPIRDLIDGVRESFRARQEMRQQARMERELNRLGLNDMSIEQRRAGTPQEYRPTAYNQPQSDRRPVPITPIPTNIGTRGKVEFVSTRNPGGSRGGFQSEEPALADPKEAAPEERQEEQQVSETPPIDDRVWPDTISIKEKGGAVAEITAEQNVSADARLNSYLHQRGSQLIELDVNGSSFSDKGLGLLNKAPNLQKLMLNDCEFNNDSMKVLGQQGLKNLKELNLHATRVGDEGIAELKNLPISTLNISDTCITDEGMQHIKSMKNLQVLNLDYGMVGNEGIKAFKDMPSLRSVSLKGTSLNDDAIPELAKAQQLMVLNLEDTKLTPAGIQKLQRAMPRTVITAPDLLGPTNGSGGGNHHDRTGRHDREQKPAKWFRSPFVVPHRS